MLREILARRGATNTAVVAATVAISRRQTEGGSGQGDLGIFKMEMSMEIFNEILSDMIFKRRHNYIFFFIGLWVYVGLRELCRPNWVHP